MKNKRFLAFVFSAALALPAMAQMRILTTEAPPANYLENGKLVGTSVDIVNQMIRLSGEKIDIEVLPIPRAMDIIMKETNVMMFSSAKTQERTDLGLYFIGPVITRNHTLVSMKNRKLIITRIEDLKNFSIGGLVGDWRSKYFQDLGYKVDLTASYESNFKKLVLGRVDFVISSDIEIGTNAKKAGINVADLKTTWVFKTASSYLMVSKKTPSETIKKWQNLFDQVVKSKAMDKEAAKWSKALNIPVAFSSGKGFYVN